MQATIPDAVNMSIKLLFETPSGRVLGAQIIGGPGTRETDQCTSDCDQI